MPSGRRNVYLSSVCWTCERALISPYPCAIAEVLQHRLLCAAVTVVDIFADVDIVLLTGNKGLHYDSVNIK